MLEEFAYRTALKHHNVVALDFIMAQLDLGITYCESAALGHDPETIRRNAVNARRVFDSAMRYRQEIEFTKREEREFLRMSALLKSRINEIMEQLYSLVSSQPQEPPVSIFHEFGFGTFS